jgi:predicted SAM-dependent methyltransferase
MSKLPYLNLGCGSHFHTNWVNVDFSKTGEGVIAQNLLEGVPFEDNAFEVAYHSHVLEHFPRDTAKDFMKECYRVLKPGGIIRIAVPDLEQIVKNYIRLFETGKANPGDSEIRADYDWIMTEMYDQTVRSTSGGEMIKYLSKEKLDNEDFIYGRLGHEAKMIRQGMMDSRNQPPTKLSFLRKSYRTIRNTLSPRNYKPHFFRLFFNKEYKLIELGKFRLSGEVHQWMYDSYSLGNLLKDVGFNLIEQKKFNESNIPGWRSFSLDEVDNAVRKPDSLFMEAVKP